MPSPSAAPALGFAHKLALSAVAASVAETATFPLDLLKTRLQLAGQQQQAAAAAAALKPRPPGLLSVAVGVVRTEGFLGLYAGLAPAVLRHLPYTGIRVLTFEQLRGLAQQQLGVEPGAPLPLPVSLAIGLTAGGLGQLVAVPADLVKVRIQADGRLVAAGLQAAPRYRGMLHALRTITAQHGMAGLWRGSLPAVQRAALVNLGELSTYYAAKRTVLSSGVTVVSTPADVIKTRLMNQDPAAPLYRGALHCFSATLRAEGLRGLYAGFWPTWARLGPWQLTFWVTYNSCEKQAAWQAFDFAPL
ncbi:hypothetical protein ABPG75_011417 [Micractinium tetrahymenae]